MTDLIVFDRSDALRRLLKSEKLLREVIGIFLRDLPRLRSQIRSAVETQSASALCLAAHSLRGSASQIGGRAVSERSWQIEQLAGEGDLASALELIAPLSIDLDHLATTLEADLLKNSE